jgi:pimeloyl-ACP methyl ester carboxylesterase
VSTPRSLDLPDLVRSVTMHTRRGSFAALQSRPASGVCERRPAILVPGYTGSKEDFIPVLRPLASASRIVTAIDMRGQYQSAAAASGDGYTPDELAADICALADEVAPDDDGVHLLGHSLGGLIARHAVLSGASRIGSLALLGSGPGSITGRRQEALRSMLDLLGIAERGIAGAGRAAGAAGAADTIALQSWAQQLWEEHIGPQVRAEGLAEHIIAFLRERHLGNCPAGLVVMGNFLLSCPDRTAELARRDGPPILVIYGENDDAWPPKVQDRMGRRLRAQRVCIPAAAHSPAIEAPETTASTLTSFWNTAEQTSRRRRRSTAGAARSAAAQSSAAQSSAIRSALADRPASPPDA